MISINLIQYSQKIEENSKSKISKSITSILDNQQLTSNHATTYLELIKQKFS